MALGGVTNGNGVTAVPGTGGGGGGDAVTSPNGTLVIGGTASNTTADVDTSHANTWTASQTGSGAAFQWVGPSTGSATVPSFAFAGQLTTGFFNASTVISVTTAGTSRFSFSTTNTSFSPLRSASGRVHATSIIVAAGTYTTTTNDEFIGINKTVAAASAVTLLTAPSTGQTQTIFDAKGDAATNNITITPTAGNIDGGASYVINTAYGSWTGVYNGTIWKTVASR